MTRVDRFPGLRRALAAPATGIAAAAGLAIWFGYGGPLCREAWQELNSLLALGPNQAVTLITGLLGGFPAP